MSLLTKLFNFVLLCVSKYNIDESHGLSHAMNILTCANKIYTQEVEKQPYLKDHEKIIYVSSVLHDMCDKKYMDQDQGMKDINNFIGTLKNDNDIPESVRNAFGRDNETVFGFRLYENNLQIHELEKKWHYIVGDERDMKKFNENYFCHMINKRFDYYF